MASHNISPVREQLRAELLACLANAQSPMTSSALYQACPSATSPEDVARVAYELKRKGLVADGGKVLHALGMKVNSYVLASPEDQRIEAAKPLVVERKIPRTGKASKPATTNPYAQFSVSKPQERAPRVTWPLPIHLKTTAPQAAAVTLDEAEMSEEPMPYITEPDTFNQEPREPEADADEGIDSYLVDALLEMAHLEPKDAAVDDVLALASEYVGDQAETRKICQCLRINSLPPLPPGYAYGGIKAWIESEHDVGRLTITTHNEGGGAFASIKASGRLSFDTGDLVTIGQVADALIKLHDSMGDNHE